MSNDNSQAELKTKLETIQRLAGECLLLMAPGSATPSAAGDIRSQSQISPSSIRFDMNVKAFIKQYGKGMSGPQKFILLLSHMVKGDTNKEVTVQEIKKLWGRMTSSSLIGMAYHTSFPARAIEYGWADSNKRGVFTLEDSWQGIFKQQQ